MSFSPTRKARAADRVARFGWGQAAALEGVSLARLQAELGEPEPPQDPAPPPPLPEPLPLPRPRRPATADEQHLMRLLKDRPLSRSLLLSRSMRPLSRSETALTGLLDQGRASHTDPHRLIQLSQWGEKEIR